MLSFPISCRTSNVATSSNNMMEKMKKTRSQDHHIVIQPHLVMLLIGSLFSFWMGRLLSTDIHVALRSDSRPMLQKLQHKNSSSTLVPETIRIQLSKPRLPRQEWLNTMPTMHNTTQMDQGSARDTPSLAFPSPVFVREGTFILAPSSSTSTSSSSSCAASMTDARMGFFQELVTHPILLTSQQGQEAERVAIVAEHDHLIAGLVQQVSLHVSVHHIYVVEERYDDCLDWNNLSSLIAVQSDQPAHVECVSMDRLPPNFQVDVAIVLDDCSVLESEPDEEHNEEDYKGKFRFWFEHLSEKGSLVTCLGETLPLDHPLSWHNFEEKMDIIDCLDESDFAKIIEYDIRLPQSRFATSVAVALKEETVMAQWRMNEAHYARLLRECVFDMNSLDWFDSATMLTLKYPPKHSAIHFCQHDNDGDNEARDTYCGDGNNSSGHGYNPYVSNVPIDQLYVDKSQAGEHAGRGVFTKVDIPADTYVGLETTVHSILYEWTTTDLHNDMMDHIPEYAKSDGHIIFVYAEAYGYSQDPWNMPQDTVMSHILTFVNHGCNGTANIGDNSFMDITEFTVDLESGVVPDFLKTKVDTPFMPHFDRDEAKEETMCRTSRPIRAGEELFDNYMSFGGDNHFREMVETLRQECSGSLGMVEQYQRGEIISIIAPNTRTTYPGHEEL